MGKRIEPPAGDERRAAENALWHDLEDRRDQIRAAGLRFSERQHNRFREAHDEGKLIATLCESMEKYKSPGEEYYKRPMAQAIKRGLPTWEEIFIRKGEPWTRFVTPRARRGAEVCIKDAREYGDWMDE